MRVEPSQFPEWRALLAAERGREPLARERVVVEFHPKWNALEDEGVSSRIEEAWRALITRHSAEGRVVPTDGLKYRLATVHQTPLGAQLGIGLSAYRTYLALREEPALLRSVIVAAGLTGEPIRAFLPLTIGNVILLRDPEEMSLAILRSQHVATYQGFVDLPGGHPEPSEVSGQENKATDSAIAVRNELFGSASRELEEELGIGGVDSPGRLLGILENCRDVFTPDMVFLADTQRCVADLIGIAREYSAGSFEVEEVLPFSLARWSETIGPRDVTPIMRGALNLYTTWREANDN